MKRVLIALGLMCSTHLSACDGTSTVVNSLVDNGNGTWTATVTACMEPDDFTGFTSYFEAQFTGANVLSASPSSVTYSDGTTHTLGAVSGSSNTVIWSGTNVSTFVSQECFTFTFVLSAKPTALNTENGHSSCFHTASFPTTTSLTCTTSSGVFTDSGGTGSNYANNQNQVTTICPDSPGGVVSVTFSGIVNTDAVFSTCVDVLSVYQGNSTTGTLIGQWCEVDPSPGTITSTDPSGCLTFQFVSDGSTTRAGWNATVSCTYTCAASGSLSGSKNICAGEDATISVSLAGTAPWSITYNDGTNNTTVNGINSSPYTFQVTPSSTKTYTLTAVSDANCTGTASGSAVVAVSSAPAPTYTDATTDVTCAGANTGTISITPSSTNTTFDWVSGPVTSPIPVGNLPGGATDERSLVNLPAGNYCVDITRTSSTTSTTTIFTETFESGSGAWTINNSGGPNIFVVNNNYPGGSCVTGLTTFTIPTVPNQPAGVTAGPTSNYLHIKATTTTGATCGFGSSTPFPPLNANFDSQISDQKVTMVTPLNTTGLTNVTISFVWLAQGETSGTDDYGAIEYSLNGGTTWTQIGAKLRNQPTWLADSRTDPSWDNVSSLLFRIRWVNDASSSSDPPLGIDEIVVTGTITGSCTNTVQECYTINNPTNVTPTFSPVSPVCQGAAAPTLPTTSTNGISGSWSPTVSTATSGTTTYTFTPTAGQCANTTTLNLTVNPILTPAITCGTSTTSSVEFNWTTLSGATSYAISYTINGGAAVNGGSTASTTFPVTGLSPGDMVNITVTPTGSGCYQPGTGSCSATACTSPVITAQPAATVTLCEGSSLTLDVTVTGASAFQWQISSNNGTSYTNLSNGGVYSGVTTTSLAISDNTGLDGMIFQLVVTGTNPACPALSNPATTLSVTPKVTPTFTAITPVCQNAAAPTLPTTSNNGVSGTWSPAVSTASAGTTTYTFTPSGGACANTASLSITVNPTLTPTISCGTTTSTSVQFTWTAVTGATGYSISYQVNGGAATSGGSITALNYTVNGLSPSSSVQITITPTGTGCFLAATQTCTSDPCTPPVINTQPVNASGCSADGATFSVSASGASGYQWQISTNGGSTFNDLSNGGVYSGVTTSTLSISDNTGLGSNQYRVIVLESNNACPVTSNAVTLTVNPILAPVVNCSGATISTVDFSWTAVGGATSYDISYRVNGGATQSGGTTTSTSFQVNGLNAGDAVEITITVTGTGCYTDGSASCTAINCTAPVISTQPADQSACPGSGVSFSITETGGNGYQWQISTDGGLSYSNLSDGGIYSGSTTTSLNVSDVAGQDGNLYRVIIQEVNNSCPTTSNSATLNETSPLPVIVNCSSSTTNDVTFSWTAPSGATSYDIQYQVNGGAMQSGGNTSATTFTASGLSAGDQVDIFVTANGNTCYIDGTVSCTASNCTSPTINTQPTDQSACTGNGISYSVSETGGNGYQWQISTDGGLNFTDLADGGVYSGSSASTLNISDVAGLDGNLYRVIVLEVNNTCPTTSQSASLTESAQLPVVVNCSSSTISDVTFGWTALSGASSYDIQYQINGGTMQSGGNTTTTSFNVSGLSAGDQVDIFVTANGSTCFVDGTASCTANNCTSPVINTQPTDQSACSGSAASFTVSETGGSGYQWQVSIDGGATFTDMVDFGVFSGSNSATLSISDNTGLNGMIFRVIVSELTNNCPVTSQQAVLTETAQQAVVVNCTSSTLTEITFGWTALSGATGYDIQYQVNGGAMQSGGSTVTTTFTVNGLNAGDVVSIFVSATGSICFLQGTVDCTASNCVSPVISTQPQDQIACPGNAASFTVSETGGNGYQWQISTDGGASFADLADGGVYSGTNTANLTISDNTGLDGNQYRVIVTETNGTCPTTSQPAELQELSVPAISANNNGPLCEGQDLQLSVTSIPGATYQWSGPGGYTATNDVNTISGATAAHAGTYTVSVSLAGCQATATTDVTIIQASSLSINPAGPFCPDNLNRMLTASLPGGVWSGPGITDQANGIFNPLSAGVGANVITYTLSGTCTATATITIDVLPLPVADFGVSAVELDPDEPVVELTNSSTNAVSYVWYFGDQMMSTEVNPVHHYPANPGNYIISLIATSAQGCKDTTTYVVTIPEPLIFYIPNAFTPNGDAHNNTFLPVFTSGYDPQNYELLIYNRWGQLIFESHDTQVGWDGTFPVDQGITKSDVYIWKVTFGLANSGEKRTEVGHVSLLK